MNPFFIKNQELALEQMRRYLLNNEERYLLKKASKKEKENLFAKFWKDRDPTIETSSNELMDEFSLELIMQMKILKVGKMDGRQIEEKIYILFGPPDNIYRSQSFNTMRTIQTWDYLKSINNLFLLIRMDLVILNSIRHTLGQIFENIIKDK